MNATPNPNQAHASIATTAAAQTLAQLGYTLHANTANLVIQVNGGTVRMTVNGTAPTAASGYLIADGERVQLGVNEVVVAKFITSTGTPKMEVLGYQG